MTESTKNTPTSLIIAILIGAAAISGALLYAGSRLATPQAGPSLDQKQLVAEISAEVIKSIEKEDLLAKQVEKAMQSAQQRRVEDQRKRQQEQQRLAQEKAKNVPRVSAERDYIRGNPNALVSLIEYSDFECPFCKRFHETPRRLLKLFDGKINWVYRHFPLAFHNPGAQKQAEASECAGELGGGNAFWKYTDALFQRTRAGGRGFPLSGLTPLAKEFGIDDKKFKTCLDSGKYAAKVQKDMREGANAGISGTPGTIIINNKTGDVISISGARPVTVFEQAIRELLQKSEGQADSGANPGQKAPGQKAKGAS